jgi:hypothetical protein
MYRNLISLLLSVLITFAGVLQVSTWAADAAKKKVTSNTTTSVTKPGMGYFVYLRLYGPLKSWFDKTWKPGDPELVKEIGEQERKGCMISSFAAIMRTHVPDMEKMKTWSAPKAERATVK